jgi:predicted HAD superfamily Cof-like phosphohydrolase
VENWVDVGKFHRKFGLDCAQQGIGPRELPKEMIEFRLKFLIEELEELASAYGYRLNINLERLAGAWLGHKDIAKVADSLIDLVYVALGTAHLEGLPWQDLWDEVQRANMSKERAQRAEQSARGSSFDVIKPAGWRAPDIEGVLTEWGWDFTKHAEAPVAASSDR